MANLLSCGASAFVLLAKDNFLKIVKPEGNHLTQINNLPEKQKGQVKFTLGKWLETPVNIE